MNAPYRQEMTDITKRATVESIISPRFYTTDFKAVDRIDVSPVQGEWDQMMSEFNCDANRYHFVRDEDFDAAVRDLPPALYEDFQDFLVTSLTSEFSGCVLYSDIKKSVRNPEIKKLMGYMSRDESRHAGFLNQSLKGYGLCIDLATLKRTKKYKYFRLKFILYATYLSEKIGYARYITIYRHLEQNPSNRFHPIFGHFKEWCNDEFRHGEAFALIMRSDPRLLRGFNKLWIRFFLLAVYATMYVRDHTRLALFDALAMNPREFGFKVFRITSAISQQVFPLTLDIDNPAFLRGLERLRLISERSKAAKRAGGFVGLVKRSVLSLAAVVTFVRLYALPTRHNDLPSTIRTAPAW